MPENERVISTVFKADISNFTASTQELNRYISQVNSEFKNSVASMQRWNDNSEGLRAKLEQLTKVHDAESRKLKELQESYDETVRTQGANSKAAQKLAKDLNEQSAKVKETKKNIDFYSDSLKELEDAGVDTREELEKLNKEIEENKKASKELGGKIAKGAATGIAGIAAACVGAMGAVKGLVEETKELRTNMAKLETSFVSANFDAKTATKTYNNLYKVLGDTGKATEASQQLAKISKNEQDLTKYTKILTGVYATFGDTLPVEGLAEAINHTAKLGSVQGNLADALEWSGLNVDDFNAQLETLNTEEERAQFITKTLNGLYGESADLYMQNNEALLAANDATNKMEQAQAALGETLEPLNTKITELSTSALVWLNDAIKNSIKSYNEWVNGTDLLTESQRETVTAAQEAAEQYGKTKKAADELAASHRADVEYVTNNLLPTLKNLVDENGNVKKGEEERAKFILGELNKALGTEYEQLSQIVDANGQIRDNIYEVIEAKKAQFLLEAYEDSYRQAVEKVAEAEKARAIQAQEIAAQEAVYNEAYKEANDARIALNEKLDKAKTEADYRMLASEAQYVERLRIEAEKQKGILEKKQGEYNKSEENLYTYYSDIAAYETASTLIMKGETDKAISYLDNLGSGFKTAAGTAQLSAQEQKKVLEQQVIDTEINARLMAEAYENGVEGVTEEMVKIAKDQAEKAKEEFYTVGGDITKGIAEGADGEEKVNWTLSRTMRNLVNKAVKAAKEAAGIQSPSKLFKKAVGLNIGLGIAEGIEDSTKDVVSATNKQIKTPLANVSEASRAVNNPLKTYFEKLVTAPTTKTESKTYNITNKFERMETSRHALHRANLETRRILKGGVI